MTDLHKHPLLRVCTPEERRAILEAEPGWERTSGVWPAVVLAVGVKRWIEWVTAEPTVTNKRTDAE